jgi:hypothetical protein
MILLLLTLATLATPASSPGALAQPVPPLAGIAPDARGELTVLLDSAQREGLPLAPLHSKIAEGIAKGADPHRIAAVVGDMVRALRSARTAIGPAMPESEWVAAAGALQAGVTTAHLRQLRTGLPPTSSFTSALVVLTDLVRRGVPPGDGVSAIARVARAGADDAAVAQLRAQIVQDMAAGMAPSAAVQHRVTTFVTGRGTGTTPVIPTPVPLDP